MPPPFAFAPLEVLLAGILLLTKRTELMLDVDDVAVQLVNVLLETVKLLLLTVVLPMTALLPPL